MSESTNSHQTQDIDSKKTPKKGSTFNKNWIIASIAIIVIIMSLTGYFIYQKYTQNQSQRLANSLTTDLKNADTATKPSINESPTSNPPVNQPQIINPQSNPIQSRPIPKYYTGKIDDKIPFRVKLDYNSAGAGNAEYTGLEVYDDVSKQTLAIKARTINSPSLDYCPDNKCNFTMQEFDNSETDPNKILALDKPVGEFQGTFDINDTEMNKITGIWTKTNSNQKLKFELNKSTEFNIEDFYKMVDFIQSDDIQIKAPIIYSKMEDLFEKNPDGSINVSKPIETRNSINTPIQLLLNQGAVHVAFTPMPGEIGNSYIMGRIRPEARLSDSNKYGTIFKNLSSAKEGQTFNIFDQNGKKLTFKVFENIVIEDTDVDEAFKVFGNKRVVTLQTNEYTSTLLKRRLVRGELISN